MHDNVIFGTVCDGLSFATVDPSQGAIVAYNNVIHDVGQGPDPAYGSSDYGCIYVANITNQGAAGSGKVQLFNNTLYNCGSRGTSASGAIALATGPVGISMDDNLIVALASERYFSSDTGSTPQIAGSNNLLFGAGADPSFLAASVSADPLLASTAAQCDGGNDWNQCQGTSLHLLDEERGGTLLCHRNSIGPSAVKAPLGR